MYYDIGLLLEKLRNEKGLSLKRLTNGLCAFNYYRDIEKGLNFPEIRLLKLLMERLGKSFNKLEIIINTKTYETELLQYRFNTAIGRGDVSGAEKLFKKMESSISEGGKISEMYYYRNRANLMFFKGDLKEAADCIAQALDRTINGWQKGDFSKLVLSTTEIENLIIYIYLTMQGQDRFESELLPGISQYIENNEIDEEEKAVLIPKLCYVKAIHCIGKGDYADAVSLCKQGLEILRKHEILFLMQAMLEIIVKYGDESDKSEYTEYLSALNRVFELYPDFSGDHYYNSIFMRCNKTLYHLDSEVIKGLRKQKKMSQEELAQNIYKNIESLSRAESGKTSMNTEFFRAMMEKLKVGKDRLNFSLICMNYEALELLHETVVSAVKNDRDTVERTLLRINELVDAGLGQNEKTLKRFRNIAKLMSLEGTESIKEESESFLFENYPIMKKEMGRPPFYDESQAIAQLEACLYKDGNIEMERKLLDMTLAEFDKSSVDRFFQFKTYGLLQRNYVGCAADARKEAVKTIKYGLLAGSVGDLYFATSAFGSELLEKDKNTGEAERYLRLSYSLVKLVGRDRDKGILQQYFYDNFGISLK